MGRSERKNLTDLFLDDSRVAAFPATSANGLKPAGNSLAPGFYVRLRETFTSSEALSLFAYDHPALRGPNPT
jgi:hypothetical protein